MPQSKKRFPNRCWMMAEIVYYFNAVGFAKKFLTTGHPGKASQRVLNDRDGQVVGDSHGNGHRGIANIKLSNQWRLKTVLAQNEFRSRTIISHIGDPVGGLFLEADGENL